MSTNNLASSKVINIYPKNTRLHSTSLPLNFNVHATSSKLEIICAVADSFFISSRILCSLLSTDSPANFNGCTKIGFLLTSPLRSEERRVGKELRWRWSRELGNKSKALVVVRIEIE